LRPEVIVLPGANSYRRNLQLGGSFAEMVKFVDLSAFVAALIVRNLADFPRS
jgi:hypothetical protein